ncbi:hypothetical protein LOAG_14116 [Loa loa]|uniref:Pecanex-like protein n=1 Tax=Loa loa TaxID=7209 RepID=A0A1I7VPP1_LOALO|nr:hypothetical protein LOAG_14116 [Loa loa]EFO14403.2 hypothetical protein LOAG_14116 [Loa loa]
MITDLLSDIPASPDSNNTLSLNITELLNLEEFPGNKSDIYGISSNKNCTDTPIVLNTTSFTNETLDSDKLTNKSDLIEIVAHSAELKFRNCDNLTSGLDANLTDLDPSIASGNETSTLIIISSSNVEDNSLLSELISVQNMTQNDTSEFANTTSHKESSTKVMSMVAASETVRELDPELKSNISSTNCLNHLYRLPEKKSDANEMLSKKNMHDMIVVSERSSIKLNFQKLFEMLRDISNALLQLFHTTTISGNITLVDDNAADNSSSAANNDSKNLLSLTFSKSQKLLITLHRH